MRLRTLHLERYGPFTGQTLSFRSGARLHIVMGPNEAGKSCALAAITDLFFGIKQQTPYDFLHEGKEMRIGAEIEGRSGERLSFRRRKGNRNTIIDAQGSALGDEALAPFLGGVTRDVFERAFGLDARTLREGAEDMLKSQGEVGASLFAAASGLRGLADLRKTLEADADGIFAPRASKDRRFYQALTVYDDARRAIRDSELRAGDWKDLNKRIEEATARLDEIKGLRVSKVAERSKLARLKRIAPIIRSIDEPLAQITALGPLPDVPLGFATQLKPALEAVETIAAALTRAQANATKAEHDLADIVVDESLLASANEILRLFSEMKSYSDIRRDLPRVQGEADDFHATLAGLATRLGLADGPEVEAMQPSDAVIAAVRVLIEKGQEIRDELSRHARSLDEELAALASLERDRTNAAVGTYPAPLHDKFGLLQPALRQLDRRDEKERALRGETRSIAEAAARLNPAATDLDHVARAPLPAAETVVRFRRTFDDFEKDISRAEESRQRALLTCAQIEESLRERSSTGPVPSTEVIASVRARRDHAWEPLRTALLNPSETAAATALAGRVIAFERTSAEADRLADAAAAEAERVAAHAADARRLDNERRLADQEAGKLSDLRTRQAVATAEWIEIWKPAAVTPLPPNEMTLWLTQVAALVARREKLQSLRDEVADIDAKTAAIELPLRALADEVGLTGIDGAAIGLVAERIEVRLRALTDAWDKVRDLDAKIGGANDRIRRLSEAEADASKRLAEWQADWAHEIVAIGLPPGASIEQAGAALAAWQDVGPATRERDNRARRVAGMQRNLDDFEQRARGYAANLAPDLAALGADAVAKSLNDRLSDAKTAETRRTEAKRRRDEATLACTECEAAAAQARAALDTLVANAGLPADTDLPVLLGSLNEGAQFQDRLRERRARLAEQGDGHEEPKLRDDLAGFDPDQVEASLARFAHDDDEFDRDSKEVFAARDRDMRTRQAWEAGTGAELAAQQRSNAEAELLVAAREWTILKLGALLLGSAIDRRRADQQDPLMGRAGALFATLTNGSFSGLAQEDDEDDTPHLVGRRVDGTVRKIKEMSEGTRDQFYLALRLAYLEDFATRAESAPFIADDLFSTSDPVRTGQGLAALAAIADRVQPIVFTHHPHVAEIARKRLGDAVDILELG